MHTNLVNVIVQARCEMEPITTNDIRDELSEIKNEEDFKRLLHKYSHRICATISISIDSRPYNQPPFIYFQDGELFFER